MDDLMSIGFDFSRLSEVKSSQIDGTLLGIHGKDLDDLKEELQHYERLGMEKDAARIMMRIKEGAVSTFLQNIGFKLLMIDEPDSEGDIRIFHVETSGDHEEVQLGNAGSHHHFHRTLLKDYTRSIPLEILRKLPDEAGLKTYVFSPSRDLDPILAFQMTWSETETRTFKKSVLSRKIDLLVPLYCPYWIGLYEWE